MARKHTLKGRIDGPTVIRVHRPEGASMLKLTKKVSKKVMHPNPPDVKKPEVTRECKISFLCVDPKNEGWIEDALEICDGDSSLAAKVFNFGLWRFLQQQETNELGKIDDLSKGAAKAIDGYVRMLGITVDAARTMILSNPMVAAKLATTKFEQFVETIIDDFATYQLSTPDEKGVSSSRYPDITDIGEKPKPAEPEPEEEEETEEK